MLNRHRNYFLDHLCRPFVCDHGSYNFRYLKHLRILQNHRNNPKIDQLIESWMCNYFLPRHFDSVVYEHFECNSVGNSEWSRLKFILYGPYHMSHIICCGIVWKYRYLWNPSKIDTKETLTSYCYRKITLIFLMADLSLKTILSKFD